MPGLRENVDELQGRRHVSIERLGTVWRWLTLRKRWSVLVEEQEEISFVPRVGTGGEW